MSQKKNKKADPLAILEEELNLRDDVIVLGRYVDNISDDEDTELVAFVVIVQSWQAHPTYWINILEDVIVLVSEDTMAKTRFSLLEESYDELPEFLQVLHDTYLHHMHNRSEIE